MKVDLIIFAGQSNMAGRGDATLAPAVPEGWGYEFRAVSDPSRLYPLTEPFGAEENRLGGIYEPGMKTGSLVSSFVTACYEKRGVPIVAVSASKGGSSINEWQSDGILLKDCLGRIESAVYFLTSRNMEILSMSFIWCQGETDGDRGMTDAEYEMKLTSLMDEVRKNGINTVFIIRIGNKRDDLNLYDTIKHAQTSFCRDERNAVLVSTKFDQMVSLGLMKDEFHYEQRGYNLVGQESGLNVALYLNRIGKSKG